MVTQDLNAPDNGAFREKKKKALQITDFKKFTTFRTRITISHHLSRCFISGDESAIGTLTATFVNKGFSVRVEATCGKKTLTEQVRSYMA